MKLIAAKFLIYFLTLGILASSGFTMKTSEEEAGNNSDSQIGEGITTDED